MLSAVGRVAFYALSAEKGTFRSVADPRVGHAYDDVGGSGFGRGDGGVFDGVGCGEYYGVGLHSVLDVLFLWAKLAPKYRRCVASVKRTVIWRCPSICLQASAGIS